MRSKKVENWEILRISFGKVTQSIEIS